MLRIWQSEEEDSRTALRLEGRLGGPWVAELERLCEDLLVSGMSVTLDLADVVFIDERGVGLLRRVSSRGATVTSTSPFVAAQLQATEAWTDPENSKCDPAAGGID
jgi:ABC-type transporter Mla MlaB component